MPSPTQATYSLEAKIAANTAIKELIDSDGYPGYIVFRNENDEEIFSEYFTDPCGTIDSVTGSLTLTLSTVEQTIYQSGTVAYAVIFTNSGSVECLRLPAEQGNSPVNGKAVLENLTLVGGETVEVASIVIG